APSTRIPVVTTLREVECKNQLIEPPARSHHEPPPTRQPVVSGASRNSEVSANVAVSRGQAAKASGKPRARNGRAGAKKRGPGETPPNGSKYPASIRKSAAVTARQAAASARRSSRQRSTRPASASTSTGEVTTRPRVESNGIAQSECQWGQPIPNRSSRCCV